MVVCQANPLPGGARSTDPALCLWLGKAVKLCNHVGDPQEPSRSWLSMGPALAVVVI